MPALAAVDRLRRDLQRAHELRIDVGLLPSPDRVREAVGPQWWDVAVERSQYAALVASRAAVAGFLAELDGADR